LLQDRFNPKSLSDAITPLLADTPQRTQMLVDLAELRARLTPTDDSTAIERVRNAVLDLLKALPK
jgi:lipid-A-disaccharide synthase